MALSVLSSRAIVGEFFMALEAAIGQSWADLIGMRFESNQASEQYAWLGQVPAMREWLGGRNPKGLAQQGITVANKKFEATIDIAVDDIRRDKTGQIMMRIRELAERTQSHWGSLLSAQILAGEAGVCYDGQFFFDTDHVEGSSGAQDNDLTSDVTTTTAPTTAEFIIAIQAAIAAMYGFKDDQGEPINEFAREFLIMVPTVFFPTAMSAVNSQTLAGGADNALAKQTDYRVVVRPNPRLTWTTKFATFRTDATHKAFILQDETGPELSAKAEGSEYEHDNDRWQFGVKASRNTGFGFWQTAVLTTFV